MTPKSSSHEETVSICFFLRILYLSVDNESADFYSREPGKKRTIFLKNIFFLE
jgi:hypothetical protein